MFPSSSSRSFLLRLWWIALLLVLVSALITLGAKKEEGILVVSSSAENFRDAPNGKKLGTLLQGTQLEKISQEGKWVRFRVEGWIWGPSLEGFEEQEEKEESSPAAPRLPLQDNLPRIKRFVNERYGVFYGVTLDEDLQRLTVRFRVPAIEREALEQRQRAVQQEALAIFGGELELASIRIETNRPDGSGPVGSEIAETAVEDIRRFAGEDLAAWKAHTRISRDGGQTWSP